MQFRTILSLPSSLWTPAQRERVAVAHLEWVRAVEEMGGRPLPRPAQALVEHVLKATPSADPDAVYRAVAAMVPGDRGISRVTEATLPRDLQQAIDRRIRIAQARVDALVGASKFVSQDALTQLREKLMAQAGRLTTGKGQLTPAQRNQITSALETELNSFVTRLKARWVNMRKAAREAGTTLSDVAFDTAGINLPPRPKADFEGSETVALFEELPDRYVGKADAIADVVNRVRQGDLGAQFGRKELEKELGLPGYAAERILRTETGRVANGTAQRRLKQHGAKMRNLKKQWVSALASTSRAAHIAAHRQIVGVEEDYTVGGESGLYPKDARFSARNSINCLCVSVPYVQDVEIADEELEAA